MAAEKGIMTYQDRTGNDIQLSFDIVRNYLVTGKRELVTDQEIMFFMGICKARGLNPFAKDCYLIKYTPNESAAIITAIDYFRARARCQEDCQGWQCGVIVQKKDGELRYSNGLVLEGEKLIGGWFEATPKGWLHPFKLEVNLAGYIKKKSDGGITKFWSEDNQPTMISKVAESQGLRKCWPNEFHGIYSAEEVNAFDIVDISPEETMPQAPTMQPPHFDTLFHNLSHPNKDRIGEYLAAAAKHNKVTVETIQEQAAANWPLFIGTFDKWIASQEKKAAKAAAKEPPQSPPVADNPQGNTNGQVAGENGVAKPGGASTAITTDQIDTIEDLCRAKDILVSAAMPDGHQGGIMHLTFEQGEQVIANLREA